MHSVGSVTVVFVCFLGGSISFTHPHDAFFRYCSVVRADKLSRYALPSRTLCNAKATKLKGSAAFLKVKQSVVFVEDKSFFPHG